MRLILYCSISVLIILCAACTPGKPRMGHAEVRQKVEALLDSINNTEDSQLLCGKIDTLLANLNQNRPLVVDSSLAELGHKFGNRLRKDKKLALAKSYHQRIMVAREKLFPNPTHVDRIRSNIMMGSVLSNEAVGGNQNVQTALLDSAMFYFSQADAALAKVENPYLFLYNKNEMATILLEKGEWMRALEGAKAMEVMVSKPQNQEYKDDFSPKILSIKLRAYWGLHDFVSGIGLEPDIIASIQSEQIYMEDKLDLLSCFFANLVDSLERRSDKVCPLNLKAIEYSKIAVKISTQNRNLEHALVNLSNMAQLYQTNKNINLAIQTLDTAWALIPSAGFVADKKSLIRCGFGEAKFGLGDLDGAMVDYRESIGHLAGGSMPAGNAALLPEVTKLSGSASLRIRLLSNIAKTYTAEASKNHQIPNIQSLEKALEVYDSLFSLVNHLRGGLESDRTKMSLAAESQPLIARAFEGCLDLHALSTDSLRKQAILVRAFDISEQNKAFSLLESVRLNNAAADLPPKLREEEKSLLALAGDSLQNEAFDQKKRAFFLNLKKQAPEYWALRYKGADISISEIQSNLLDSNQAILSYFCSGTAISSFFIPKIGAPKLAVAKANRDSLTLVIQRYRQLVAAPSGDEVELNRLSKSLYALLIGDAWEGLLPPRLIIIPDGPLNMLSFEALQKPIEGGKPEELGRYLIYDYAFSYCFSAAMLAEMKGKATPKSLKPALAIFAPAGNEQDGKTEASNIKDVLGEKCRYYGPEVATKPNFWEASKKYASLHVITHGRAEQNPDKSLLQFTPAQDSADAFLLLQDIHARRLHQELIVFSACETAVGTYAEGEGTISLARGLAYAGARSLVSTYWSVMTDGKSRIMPIFYKKIFKEGKPKDVALAEAKRQMLQRNETTLRPANWAGIILVGATDFSTPPDASNAPFALTWVLGLGFGIGSLAFLYRKFKSFKRA